MILPVAAEPARSTVIADFGDASIDFALALNVTKSARVTLEGRNLTNDAQYRTMYAASPATQTYASTGRIITGGLSLSF